MEIALARKLIERKLIKEESQLTVAFDVTSIDKTVPIEVVDIFVVNSIIDTGADILFELNSITDGRTIVQTHRRIKEIEGMEPYRFAKAYDITAEGILRIKNRPGPKPKLRLAHH